MTTTLHLNHFLSQSPSENLKQSSSVHTANRDELRQVSATWRKQAAAHLFASGLYHHGDELERCSDPARAWQALVCTANEQHYQAAIVPTCKLPYCPMCARARSAELARQYTPIVQDAYNCSPRHHRLRHVVLTTPYEIVHSDIDRLCDSIWTKAVACLEIVFGVKQRKWKKQDIGVLGGWEFGETGHKLHIHLLVLSPWIDFEGLIDAWTATTDTICQVAHVKGVRDLESGVREVTKYATKLTEMPPALVPVLHGALSGKRRVRAFGVFYGKVAQVEQLPQVCPVCAATLAVVPLLNLRTGNNFAWQVDKVVTKFSYSSGIPPPEQLPLLPTHDFVYG